MACRNLGIAYENRGIAYSEKGDYDRAIQDFDRVIRLFREYPSDGPKSNTGKLPTYLWPETSASTIYNRGLAYSDKADYDRAIQDFDQAIKLQPNFAEAISSRKLALSERGEQDSRHR